MVARIRSVLANDPTLGTRPVQIHVTSGRVRLTGRVYSAEEATQLIAIVQSVPGVVAVDSDVQVVPAPPPGARVIEVPEPERDATERPARSLLAVGVSLTRSDPRSGELAARTAAGPVVRLGSGTGLGVAIAFNWTASRLLDLEAASPRTLGVVRVRPIMGGVGYTWAIPRGTIGVSLVGGYSFNSLRLGDIEPGDVIALQVDNSLAWRPGVSLWYDLGDRWALHGFGGYLVVHPRALFLDRGELVRRTLNAETSTVSVGIAYKLF